MPEAVETTSVKKEVDKQLIISKPEKQIITEKTDKPEEADIVDLNEGMDEVELLRVYGQGPVKPLVLYNELPDDKRKEWDEYKKDPLKNQEPSFRVLEGDVYLERMGLSQKILDENKALTQEELVEKFALNQDEINKKLIELQRLGRFGLNRYGRQNALAAAKEILNNPTKPPKRVLTSGGHTLPPDAGKYLPRERIEALPSEGDLIADIIKRQLRAKDFKVPEGYESIDEYVSIQKDSTNTLIEFANMMNEHPDWLEGRLVLIGAEYHIERIGRLAQLFIPESSVDVKSAQKVILAEMARINSVRELHDKTRPDDKKVAKTNRYNEIVNWMINSDNKDFEQRLYEDIVWSQALEDPEILSYWLGFVGAVEKPDVLQRTIDKLSDEKYKRQAEELFRKIGINFDGLVNVNLSDPKNIELFEETRSKISKLMNIEYRDMPEESKKFKKRLVPANTLLK